jgi:hypothetical protein
VLAYDQPLLRYSVSFNCKINGCITPEVDPFSFLIVLRTGISGILAVKHFKLVVNAGIKLDEALGALKENFTGNGEKFRR